LWVVRSNPVVCSVVVKRGSITSDFCFFGVRVRFARFFLVKKYQKGKKYTELPGTIPNVH
jgi:hypothetical protein